MSELNKEYFDEQFEHLTSAVKTGFDAVSAEFVEVKSDIKDLQTDVKDIQNRLDRVERKVDKAFIDGLDRHEKWIKQIADKVGVRLEV